MPTPDARASGRVRGRRHRALVPFSSISDDDLAQTGEADIESLRRRAAHAGPIDDDTLVYRVEFHVVPPAD